MTAPTVCPLCGSENIGEIDPQLGFKYHCRDCGAWLDEVVERG